MADTIHDMHGGNDVDAFSDNSYIILGSNQTVVEPLDQQMDVTLAS